MRLWLPVLLLLLAALPASAEDYAALCRSEAQRGQIKPCQKAIAATPRDPELHALLGHAYFANGLYLEGLDALRTAIAKSNGAPAYRYRFAGFAALVNEYEQAARELELAVSDDANDVKAWALLADCYRSLKDQPQVLRASQHAAELGDPAEAYLLGMRYGNGDGVPADYKEEQRWLEKAARGGHVGAMQELALLYLTGRPGIPPSHAKQKYWDDAARKAVR